MEGILLLHIPSNTMEEKKRRKITDSKKISNNMLLGCFGGFYGISTFVGYLMPNPFLYK